MIEFWLPFGAALLASAFMAWAIGAGSSGATPFAPAVGANAISVMRAAFIVGILGFLGAALQGASVSEAVGSDLVVGLTLPTVAVIVVLVTAAGLMAIGIVTGYPIATAFTVTGTVIGAGLALGGSPAWAKYTEIGTMWLLTPFVGGGVAYGIARVLPRQSVDERDSVPILAAAVGAIVVNIEFTLLASGDRLASLSTVIAERFAPGLAGELGVSLVAAIAVGLGVRVDISRNGLGGLRRFLLVLGGLVAFSAGASQVGLAVGPLVPLVEETMITVSALAAGGGVGLLIGSWTGASQMIKAVSQDYASLGPRRSIAALFPSFVLAQIAVLYGIPVSFNQIMVSAIVGAGAAVGGSDAISRRKIVLTFGAWIGSFALAFALGYGVMSFVP
ncbi:inorganic phosphate transporter [Halohasta litorea]|uniref:Phosphate transporter n=1 Tax=Halohasta litorea TaxID=869891 RepID=A0ABD6D9V2_9EURY|nr:inorganic phosphate transporter [Halohasta litorea]